MRETAKVYLLLFQEKKIEEFFCPGKSWNSDKFGVNSRST